MKFSPPERCHAILKGLHSQLLRDGILHPDKAIHPVCRDPSDVVDHHEQEFIDDISGANLNPKLIKTARREELDTFREHQVYAKVHVQECLVVTGRTPIGSMWIHINKGDDGSPAYRSRRVAKEKHKRKHEESIVAATPPLEANKLLFSLATTSLARSPHHKSTPKTLLFSCVKRTELHADALLFICVKKNIISC